MRRLLGVAVVTGPLLIALAAPASAGSSRMTLDCGGDIGTIERTNGASWWGVDDDAGYVSQHLTITDDEGQLVHEQSYGRPANGERSTCVAQHFGWTWTVELVRTR